MSPSLPVAALGASGFDCASILAAVPGPLRPQFFTPAATTRLAELANALRPHDVGAHLAWTPGGSASVTEAAPDASVLVTAWGMPPLDAALLDKLPSLRLVAHTGATVRPFVTPELFARGIQVTQAGWGMARSVAEVALTFTLALLHQVERFDHALRTGSPWEVAEAAPPRHEILRCRIGVIGASRTGRQYIALVRALGARVSVFDPYLNATEAKELGVEVASLDEVLSGSRIVAVHAPTLPETHHLIGARELALMPDGAGLVNTARSWLVDEDALVAQVASGRIDAAIDVYDAEPLPTDHPLRSLPNVLLTPHQAAGTVECRARQGDLVVDEIARLASGERLVDEITPQDLERMA